MEEGQSEKERGPGAGPPGLLLREGGSSESIRTVSPANTHPLAPPPSSPAPRSSPRSRGTPTGRPTTFSSAPQFSPLFPFITARRKSGWVDPGGGSGHLYFSPTLHLDLLFLLRLLLSSPTSYRPTGVGRSYDLHPSCLAELPHSLPLTLSCPLPSPTDVRARPFGNESRFQRCLSTSSYSYRPSSTPTPARVPPTCRLSNYALPPSLPRLVPPIHAGLPSE